YCHMVWMPDGSVRRANFDLSIHANPDGDPIWTIQLRNTPIRETGNCLESTCERMDKTLGKWEGELPTGPPTVDPEPYVVWARAIGAGFAAAFGLGGQEKADLEEVAVKDLVAACYKFDAEKSPTGDCKVHRHADCRECKF